jgi:hypothetical protein
VRVEDVDLGEVGNISDVENDAANGLRRGVVEIRNLVDEEAELAGFGGEEGVERVGVILSCVEGGTDTTAAKSACAF